MSHYQLTYAPAAKAQMLIRKPVAQVFEAFVDPAITTSFSLPKAAEGSNQANRFAGLAIEPNTRILIEWSAVGAPTTVEWIFTTRPDNTTFVAITNSGLVGDGDEMVKQAMGSTAGFMLVLAGLKALLEHDIDLNLVRDRFPNAIVPSS